MAAVPVELRLCDSPSFQVWPLSISYPAPSGHLETRALLRNMAGEETNESVKNNQRKCKKDTKNIGQKIKEFFFGENVSCEPDIDETDGVVVTDVWQGVSLILDSNWRVQWNTYHYGVAILAAMWSPAIPAWIFFWSQKENNKAQNNIG